MKERKCWICQLRIARTNEHIPCEKVYKSLKWDDPKYKIFKTSNGIKEEVINSKDEKITIKNILCLKCNNEITQDPDNSFQDFIKYILENEEEIKSDKQIDFRKIYPNRSSKVVSQKQIDLVRYFAKVLGCGISDNLSGKEDRNLKTLGEFVGKSSNFERFGIRLRIKEDFRESKIELANSVLLRHALGDVKLFYSFLRINWIKVEFFYIDTRRIDIGLAFKRNLFLGYKSEIKVLNDLDIAKSAGQVLNWIV